MPLSSQTNSTGAGSFWYAVQRGGVERGLRGGVVGSRRRRTSRSRCCRRESAARGRCACACSIATAVPSALGRCEAMVEVCGSTHSGLLPQTLWRPPRGRIVLAGRERQRRIHDRIHARQLAEALGHEAAGAVVQERRIGVARQPRDHRVAFVAAASRSCRRPCSARAARAPSGRGGARSAATRTARGSRAHRARCRRGWLRPAPASRRRGRSSRCTNSLEVDVADLGAVDAFHARGDGIGGADMVVTSSGSGADPR